MYIRLPGLAALGVFPASPETDSANTRRQRTPMVRAAGRQHFNEYDDLVCVEF